MGDLEPSSGLYIESIDGLGPANSTINTTDISTNDGSVYNSARLQERNIVFTFLFTTQNPTAEQARLNTYKYFPIKKKIKIEIVTDTRKAFIYGYVESNSPNIFSEETGAQISVICPDPYFYAIDGKTVTSFSGITSKFHFPWHNSVDFEEIVMGTIETIGSRTIYYTGDSDVGIKIDIHAVGPVVNPTVYNIETQEFVTIDTTKLQTLTGQGIIAGDDITISTVRGNKSIMLLRNGNYYNILNTIGRNSDWFQLSEGDNVFAYVADDGGENMMITIENEVIYEGI
jgi:hypothetical protein